MRSLPSKSTNREWQGTCHMKHTSNSLLQRPLLGATLLANGSNGRKVKHRIFLEPIRDAVSAMSALTHPNDSLFPRQGPTKAACCPQHSYGPDDSLVLRNNGEL